MKVILCVLLLAVGGLASHLVTQDDLDALFIKYFKGSLSETEQAKLEDVFELARRPQHVSRATLANDVGFRVSLSCIICRSAFAALFQSVNEGQSDEEITEVLTGLCSLLGIQSYTVCRGAVALNMPILVYIIRNTPEAQPNTFCGLVLQTASDPNVCPINDSRFEWTVDLPEIGEVPVPQISSTPLKIAVLTDAHIDPMYEAGGVAECDAPTCCRYGQTPKQNYVYQTKMDDNLLRKSLVETDDGVAINLDVAREVRSYNMKERTRYAPARNSAPAGYWGDYRSCDTPIWAYENVIDEIRDKHKDIDLIYYIGDSIDHGVWETTYELVSSVNRRVVDKIHDAFGDDVPVMMAIGNHDTQPTNQFAPARITETNLSTAWLYESLVDKWGRYLDEDAKETLMRQGDFAMEVRPGLKVISINNNVAYRDNWWLVYDPQDAKLHLEWLVSELYAAEQAGQRVHLLAHIPPGVHDLTHTWTREWNRIVNRFSSTITAEFNGHTHSDEFKIYYSESGEPSGVAWGGGAATSYSYYNLNYKVVTVDSATYGLTQMENYVYNLTEANLTPNRSPHWFMLYDLKQRFGLTDLTASSINDLVNRMVTTDKQLLDLYSAFFSKLSDSRWPYCNVDCKLDNLCKIVVTVLWERDRCESLTTLYNST